MWCIIGLGNPGESYRGTRHNLGFDVVDLLSQRWGIPIQTRNPLFLFGSGDFQQIPVLLVKPATYMNRSGNAYRRLRQDPEIHPQQTLIIMDDIHLPLGKLRIRPRGSHGGHNGLRSILEAAETQEMPRLRIGVEGSDADWMDHVLSPFSRAERTVIDESLLRVLDAVETLLQDGMEKAMNLYNR